MGILGAFKRGREDINWDSIKRSDKVYPENSFSLITTQTENGKPATGWVDMAYLEYKYKKYCPFNLQFSVEISSNNKSLEDSDIGTIEDYFVNELKKGCVVHPVARVITDFGFLMDLYVDDSEFASETLKKMYESPDKLVEFGCGFNHDPKWKEYKRITKLTK